MGRCRALCSRQPQAHRGPARPAHHRRVGIKNFDATTWHGLVAPAHTPNEVIATLNRALAGALADSAVKTSLADLGVDIIGGTPEEFAAYIKSEIPKWTAIIKASGAKWSEHRLRCWARVRLSHGISSYAYR